MSTNSLATGSHSAAPHSLRRTMDLLGAVVAAFRDGQRARAAYRSAVANGDAPGVAAAAAVLIGRKSR